MRTGRFGFLAAVLLGPSVALIGTADSADPPKVIVLTQVGCQFLESENGVDHKFKTTKKADCDAINARTGNERLAKAKVMQVAPGEYEFRVVNKNVPYELGFWLRSKGYDWRNPIHKFTKTSVSGGGLMLGMTKSYKVKLEPGEYVYSCPLNPTPDYRLVVKEK